MDIVEFYRKNSVEKQFDEEFYLSQNNDLNKFYQPYCKNNKITERQRLFYHYVFFGKKNGMFKNKDEKKRHREERLASRKRLRGRDEEIDLRGLEKYIIEENMDGYVADHNKHYFINRYAHKVLESMSQEDKENYIINKITKSFEDMNNIEVQEKISEKYPEIIMEEID
jgi:hypothetical protein